MLNKIKIVLLLISSMSAAMALPVNTTQAVPKNLHVYNTAGNTYVDLVPHGCSGTRYILNPIHSKYDAIVSILLSAQIAGKNVVLRYEGCNSNLQGQIVGVYLP